MDRGHGPVALPVHEVFSGSRVYIPIHPVLPAAGGPEELSVGLPKNTGSSGED